MTSSVSIPKVSLCIPVRNGERYLQESLASCTKQSFQDIEIIVVDNCSTDNTENLVKKLQKHDDRITYIRNDTNIGLIGNFNKCLEYARGEYIKFLCSDDLLHPECLELMVPHLDEDKTIQLVVSGRLILDADGKPISLSRYSSVNEKVAGKKVIRKCLFGRNYIGEPSAVLFRADTAKRGFRNDFQQMGDIEMWFYLLEKGEMFNIPGPVCSIRNHDIQLTKSNIKSGLFFDDYFRLFELYNDRTYLEYTVIDLFKRRFVVAIYVWRSRNILSKELKQKILSQGSYQYIYYLLIPVVSYIFFCVGKIKYYLWSYKIEH